jgi:tRNA threonylcarbamoyladenosine biosynthesis protein TsaE
MKTTIHSLEEMHRFAADFVKKIFPKETEATVVGLSGDLGAGKTSFTQGVARACGITDAVVSPTFVIMKIYPISHHSFLRLIHIDAYRLEKPEELLNLGWQEIIADPTNIILVEWCERVVGLMPENSTTIHFEHVSEKEREVEILEE